MEILARAQLVANDRAPQLAFLRLGRVQQAALAAAGDGSRDARHREGARDDSARARQALLSPPAARAASGPGEHPRNAVFAFGIGVVSALFTGGLTLFLVRDPGLDDYGIYALALSVGGVLIIPADFGVTHSAARFVAERRTDTGEVIEVIRHGIRLKAIGAGAVRGAHRPRGAIVHAMRQPSLKTALGIVSRDRRAGLHALLHDHLRGDRSQLGRLQAVFSRRAQWSSALPSDCARWSRGDRCCCGKGNRLRLRHRARGGATNCASTATREGAAPRQPGHSAANRQICRNTLRDRCGLCGLRVHRHPADRGVPGSDRRWILQRPVTDDQPDPVRGPRACGGSQPAPWRGRDPTPDNSASPSGWCSASS